MDATKAVDDIVNSIPNRKPPLDKQLAGNVLRPSLRSAVKYRDPLGPQKVFLTDTERNSALSNEFRDLARACVTAACETKAFRGLVKQIDKDLGIKR